MALDLSQTAIDLIRSLAAKAEDEVFFLCYDSGGTVDPDSGQWTPGATIKTAVDGARVQYNASLIDGINIQTGDFQLLVPPSAVIPDENFWIEDEKFERYSVVSTNEVNHAGKLQLNKFQLRRS